MADASSTSFLPPIVAFCAAAVVAVPVAQRLGIGGVLGYMVGGIVIGPSVLGIIHDPSSVRHIAEMGVVLLLFIIGLELKLSRLIQMRRDIFGLGLAQLLVTAIAIAGIGVWAGLTVPAALAVGMSFGLSATSIALQILDERGDLQTPYGQRTFAVLLFQDISIVPLLALIPLLAPFQNEAVSWAGMLRDTSVAIAAMAALVLAGLYLLNPMFRLLASLQVREIMTAAALLVVLGSALLMETVGLSMALGAFVAGLMLAESNFKHQLEADIEPFRGLLLGLFFMSVGMGLDLKVLMQYALPILGFTMLLVLLKISIAALLLRVSCSNNDEAWRAGALLASAGEFSFVLVPMAAALTIIKPEQSTLLLAIAALTMLAGPLSAKAIELFIARRTAKRAAVMSDLPEPNFDGANGSVLVIGFGRFGQMVTQVLLTEGVDITVIDHDVEIIATAARFGFKVYYGDGTQLNTLQAAGAARARIIAVCTDGVETTTTIATLIKTQFPLAQAYVRAYDRRHVIALNTIGVESTMRELLFSALAFGGNLLRGLGLSAERAREVVEDVRKRDEERLILQQTEGLQGVPTLVRPEPLTKPRVTNRALSEETLQAIAAGQKHGPSEAGSASTSNQRK